MTPTARNLLDLLSAAPPKGAASPVQELSPPEWEEIVALAQSHGVAPLLHRALQARVGLDALPEVLLRQLAEARRATALANLRHCAAFREFAQAFAQQDIPLMALKGLHLAERVYRDISLRPMGDVDILVPQSKLGSAAAILQRLGYGPEGDMSEATAARLATSHAVLLEHRGLGTVIELHRTLGEADYGYEAPLADIWRTALPGKLADADALLMSPEFLLLHVCAHLACNHTFVLGISALCDIAEIVRAYPAIDWKIVIDQGSRHGWRRGIAAALQLTRDQLGAAVPQEVLAELGANALDQDMLSEALTHVLSSHEVPEDLSAFPNFLAFVARRGPAEKLTLFWRRVFMPRSELALLYGVPLHSPRLLLYYAVRLRDLLRQYAARAWSIQVSDPNLRASLERHARLRSWTAGVR